MITVQDLTCGYEQPVLDGANFAIQPGKITALIGPNGSGKSTLAQVLSGLKSFRGMVRIDDLRLTKHTSASELRRAVGIVFQNPEHQILFSRVADDLRFVLDNLHWPPSEIESAIEAALTAVNLAGYEQTNPHDLSGGQKQRLAIASALLTHPRYLILDEATSMLDSESRQSIYRILSRLAEEGIGILMITNLLDELLLSDKVLFLQRGKVQSYTQQAIIDQPELLTQAGLRVPFVLQLAHKYRAYSWPELAEHLDLGAQA